MHLPLDSNRIRTDGPGEALNHSFNGRRIDPHSSAMKYHKGWDLLAPVGTAVYAIADGKVRWQQPVRGYGLSLLLEIDSPPSKIGRVQACGVAMGSNLYILYAHLSAALPKAGVKVRAGEQIAKTGKDGNAFGTPPHLHLEVLLNERVVSATGRLDPGELFGYDFYACGVPAIRR